MNGSPTVFISCGQFTETEKRLGRQIAQMVKTVAGLEPFFAENVQDLNGLDDNILKALQNCAAFIVVLHPRGTITRPDNTTVTRASVWIEQEIAIATYIQRVEKRELRIAAFKHRAVDREGLRELLHLNPTAFTDESEVLLALSEQLMGWRSVKSTDIHLELKSEPLRVQDQHPIRQLSLLLFNETNERVSEYDFEIRIPEGLLKHWNAIYPGEIKPSPSPNYRCFRWSQEGRGTVLPHDQKLLVMFEYCTTCGIAHHLGVKAAVSEEKIRVRAWINNREYSVERSLKEMALEAERRKA
jgi:hypothetical protein